MLCDGTESEGDHPLRTSSSLQLQAQGWAMLDLTWELCLPPVAAALLPIPVLLIMVSTWYHSSF